MTSHMTTNSPPSWSPVLYLSATLLLLVGPFFGPVAIYANEALGVREGAGLIVSLFMILFGLIAYVTVRWHKNQGGTLEELGWRAPTRTSTLIVAVVWGILWATFNVMGYVHQFDTSADWS